MTEYHAAELRMECTSLDEWLGTFEALCRDYNSRRWWLGDALNYGESEYGEQYAQAESVGEAYGLLPDTLRQYQWVAGRFAPGERMELPWSYHREVSGLENPAQRRRMLIKALNGRWDRRQLRDAVQEANGKKTAYTRSWRQRAALWKACAKHERAERLTAENYYPGNRDAVELTLEK